MDITTVIQNLGFPIACVVACGWFIFQNQKAEREENARREERNYSQLEKFSETMDNFNTTLTKIDARLEALEKKIE